MARTARKEYVKIHTTEDAAKEVANKLNLEIKPTEGSEREPTLYKVFTVKFGKETVYAVEKIGALAAYAAFIHFGGVVEGKTIEKVMAPEAYLQLLTPQQREEMAKALKQMAKADSGK